ncbi:hypothetical protein KBA41_18300 [Candidatus Ozemobacteraceae bacterium]|nr:hypothetical protein [Candidatus Ozemobacteraceae bacterium]
MFLDRRTVTIKGMARRFVAGTQRRGCRILCCLFLLLAELAFSPAFAAAGAGTPISGPGKILEFVFEAGAATSTISPVPAEGQIFQTAVVEGATCLIMRHPGTPDPNWRFVLSRDLWREEFGDAVLTLEYIATMTSINWFQYDSRFHEFHRIDDSLLGQGQEDDSVLALSWKNRTTGLYGYVKQTYVLPKVGFHRRLAGYADFQIHAESDAPLGLRRIVLRITPLTEADRPDSAPRLTDLVGNMYFRLLGRQPSAWEWRVLEDAFGHSRLRLRTLLRNLIKCREYRLMNVFPLDSTRVIRRLFWCACRRRPSVEEVVTFLSHIQRDSFDFPALVFVEKYYLETIESILAESRSR